MEGVDRISSGLTPEFFAQFAGTTEVVAFPTPTAVHSSHETGMAAK